MQHVLLYHLFMIGFVNAHLNVFIAQDEVMKLLGINAELFYVREGVVNAYALNFIVMIPANVSDLQFSWQSLTKHPLPYVLTVNYDNQGAMLPPQMNISSTGVIPTSVQTFRVKLLCTGLKSAEVQVQLQLNVSAYNRLHNDTSLKFRRNKICLKGIAPPLDSLRLDPEELASSASSLYIAAACSLAMIIFVILTTSAVCLKTKKMSGQEPHYMSAVYDNNQHVFVRLGSTIGRTPSAGSGSYATIASIHKSPPSPSPYATSEALRVSHYASSQLIFLSQDPQVFDPIDRLLSLSMPQSNMNFQGLTQEGTFGQIYRGKLVTTDEPILIKTVREVASKVQITLFLNEGTMMSGIMHKNVLPLIAANIDNARKPLLIYPYVNRGNLKRFLTKCRQQRGTIEQYTLSTRNLVEIGIQIILGIIYLHSQCLLHKDLATRNCVIDDNLQVKITDNALARDLFPNDYFCVFSTENRPIKWLALECFLHKQFTSASDLWSFGVLLWELTTLAQQPYIDIHFFDMLNHLENGYRLNQPTGCPDELYAVMNCCWFNNPLERPTFAQLLSYLQEFHIALGKYI